MKVLNYGLDKKFYDRYEPEELLDNLGISGEKIIEELKKEGFYGRQ
jgi:1-deoxy-D-xylulose-5-phosphate synthase